MREVQKLWLVRERMFSELLLSALGVNPVSKDEILLFFEQ